LDIAFGALVLAMCVTPALTFRAALRSGLEMERGPTAVEPTFLTLGEELRWILPLSLAIHVVAIGFAGELGYIVDWPLLLSLISGNDELLKFAIPRLAQCVSQVALYAVATICGAHILGLCIQYVVRRSGMHRRYGWFEYRSRWAYLFLGDSHDNATSGLPDFIHLELRVAGTSEPRRYEGVLDSFWLDAKGELIAVSLEHPILEGTGKSTRGYAVVACKDAEVAVIRAVRIEVLQEDRGGEPT